MDDTIRNTVSSKDELLVHVRCFKGTGRWKYEEIMSLPAHTETWHLRDAVLQRKDQWPCVNIRSYIVIVTPLLADEDPRYVVPIMIPPKEQT